MPNPISSAHRFYQEPAPTGDFRFFQIAWVVPDLIAACRKWVDVFGVGPFSVMPKRAGAVTYRGTAMDLEMQLAVTQMGPVQIELIEQSSDAASVYREIFPQGSGGLHHMCTFTDDFDATRAHYDALGYPLIAEINAGLRVGYFDTYRDFGFITEVVQRDEGFTALLTNMAKVCDNWDGTDPIRILQRGGYRTPE